MKTHLFRCQQWLPLAREEVFDFYSDAFNLERLTPPFLKFRVLTPPPIVMREGVVIDYRLRLRGFPVRWRSRITLWEPPRLFVDEQVRGPYRLWRHRHVFEEVDGGTLAVDSVEYAVPGGALVNRFLVEPDLKRIFDYRQSKLAVILTGPGPD